MQSRFLDPKNDFAFKKVFGSEKNKDILIHFLNDILDHQHIGLIQTVEFLPTVSNPETAAKKQSILDVMCQDDKGMFYIVEMQVASTGGFEKRAQYYAAKAYSNQLNAGDAYENLKEVIFIAITDFLLFPEKKAVKSDHILLDKQTKSHDLRDLYFTFIELPKFIKSIHELESITDKWYYYLKHAPETITEAYKELVQDAPIIERAYEELDRFNWTEAELNTYDRILKRDLDNASALRHQLKEVKEQGELIVEKRGMQKCMQKGMQEGKKEGMQTKSLEIARTMLQKRESQEKVVEFTGLSKTELEQLVREIGLK